MPQNASGKCMACTARVIADAELDPGDAVEDGAGVVVPSGLRAS
jgi:hypothetical protein